MIDMEETGTIDWLVVEFAGGKEVNGELVPPLLDLVNRRLIRVLDALILSAFTTGEQPFAQTKRLAKVLKSATANAENNHDLSADDLVIVAAIADEGTTIKRFRPRAQGRAFPIHKPMTHVTIVVESKEA